MGTVIKFPDEGRIVRFGRADAQDESATVIILPVIRIERYDDPSPRMPVPIRRRPRQAKVVAAARGAAKGQQADVAA